MNTKKIVSLILMAIAVVFFFIFLYYTTECAINDGALVGIWFVAVGTFITGAVGFYSNEPAKTE
jgi:hypothetical protein